MKIYFISYNGRHINAGDYDMRRRPVPVMSSVGAIRNYRIINRTIQRSAKQYSNILLFNIYDEHKN